MNDREIIAPLLGCDHGRLEPRGVSRLLHQQGELDLGNAGEGPRKLDRIRATGFVSGSDVPEIAGDAELAGFEEKLRRAARAVHLSSGETSRPVVTGERAAFAAVRDQGRMETHSRQSPRPTALARIRRKHDWHVCRRSRAPGARMTQSSMAAWHVEYRVSSNPTASITRPRR